MENIQVIKNRFGIVGFSPLLKIAIETAIKCAPTNLTVLIVGESGVGKENISKIIHTLSTRKHKPFIAINCGAIPEGTIDSELFGHEKGAFTGAIDFRKGYFETVNGGTIFLDEIGEMPLSTQARLLRVLENGEYIKVGSSSVQKTDVRIIAATNKNLYNLAQNGKFREDLYYRLNTIEIKIPPLRERKEDIGILFKKFIDDFSKKYNRQPIQFTDEALHLIKNQYWKGNIRELKNLSEQITILNNEEVMSDEDLQPYLKNNQQNTTLLPVLSPSNSINNFEFQNEREILYKYIFDLKKDVFELKSMFTALLELIRNPKFSNNEILSHFKSAYPSYNITNESNFIQPENPNQPLILNKKPSHINSEESLNILEKEKELVEKALIKHKGKRKETAFELGISSRTLIRKIKEFNLENLF